jgi:hypothetical protein
MQAQRELGRAPFPCSCLRGCSLDLFAVALCGQLEPFVVLQRQLVVTCTFLIDEAERGDPDSAEIFLTWCELSVLAGCGKNARDPDRRIDAADRCASAVCGWCPPCVCVTAMVLSVVVVPMGRSKGCGGKRAHDGEGQCRSGDTRAGHAFPSATVTPQNRAISTYPSRYLPTNCARRTMRPCSRSASARRLPRSPRSCSRVLLA